MEKGKPHHDINAAKEVFADPEELPATGTAYDGARELGLGPKEMVEALQGMERKHFYKSMTSYWDHKQWQDVYLVPYGEWLIYIKFTNDVVTDFRLLSFKEK